MTDFRSVQSGCLNGNGLAWLTPDWPAPDSIHALTTLRSGGISVGSFHGLNLADHVGDNPALVAANRTRLAETLQLPTTPFWLSQVHGVSVAEVKIANSANNADHRCVEADASLSFQTGCVCAVLTADCLPLLLCDRDGTRVAAIHAGWRGLAAGVIESTVRALAVPLEDLLVWMGPAIGPEAFTVGADVRSAFVAHDAAAQQAFQDCGNDHYQADIYCLARLRLHKIGIEAIYGGHWCSFSQADMFYSYRRETVTGRMASLIWRS